MTADTPTLSPAARARVEKAMRELERAAFDPFMPYNPDPARAALTATVAALVAEAEARGREAAEARLNALRTAVVEFWGPPATIADLAQPSPAQQRLLDALAVARPATTERTPTPHAAWCQSRFPMRGAPLPCNCAGQPTPTEGDP